MADLADLEDALRNADAAGDAQAAQALANEIVRVRGQPQAPSNIADMAKQYSMPTPPNPQIARQVGLTVRAGLGGLGGIANMVLDPAVAGINRVAGTSLPLPSGAMERALTNAGLPEPQAPVERIAQTGARAMVPVAGSVQLGRSIPMLAPLAASPGMQLFSAGSGGASSQAAQEAGAGPGGQALAGLVGGVAGPTALTAANTMARAALRVPGSLIAPFTEAGRTNIAARAFQSSASNPRAAIDAINTGSILVPGTNPTTAELANDTGISGLYKTLLNNPQTGGPLRDVAESNDAARQAFLAQRFGNPASIQTAKTARDAITGPMRDAAFANAGPIDTAPIVAAGNQTLEAGAKYRGALGTTLSKFVNDISQISDPQVLYNGPRKAINDAIGGKVGQDNPLAQLTKAELTSLRGMIDDRIEAVAPGFKNYLGTHAQFSRQIDAKQLGQNITQAATNPYTEQLSGPKFARQVQQNAPDVANMGAQGSDAITRVNEDLKRANAPLNAVRAPGSDTVANGAGNELFQRLLGHVPGGVVTKTAAKVANLVYSVPQDQVREMILNGMIDPRLGAALLARRIPERPDLIGGLLAQRFPISYGGLLGAASAQQ